MKSGFAINFMFVKEYYPFLATTLLFPDIMTYKSDDTTCPSLT